MPTRIMLASVQAAHNVVNRALDNAERMVLSKTTLKELERKRVDRTIKELYDELYGRNDERIR